MSRQRSDHGVASLQQLFFELDQEIRHLLAGISKQFEWVRCSAPVNRDRILFFFVGLCLFRACRADSEGSVLICKIKQFLRCIASLVAADVAYTLFFTARARSGQRAVAAAP